MTILLISKNHASRTLALILMILPLISAAQQWNPNPGWKDSYAVGGKCYCDSNGYDHGLDTKSADTPIGVQNVVAICEQIERVLGEGPVNGRIPYNDIQCGNGPANDAADEAGCPGRVDIGPDGCNQIGPKWDLESAYADVPDTPAPTPSNALNRNNWVLSANNNEGDLEKMLDGQASTRWTTRETQTNGQWLIIDLAAVQRFDRIVLNSASSPNDFPRAYSVFVSSNGQNWGNPIRSDVGQGPITSLSLPPQNKRFIRINQTGSSDRYWWSIHELQIYNDSTPEPTGDMSWISSIISTLLMLED